MKLSNYFIFICLCALFFGSHVCVCAQGAIVPPSCEFAKECFSMSQKTGDEAEYEGDCSVDAYESCLNDWCAANSVACKQLSSSELTFMHLFENDFFADSLLYKVEFGLLDEFNSEEPFQKNTHADIDKLSSIFKDNLSLLKFSEVNSYYDPSLSYEISDKNKILYSDDFSDGILILNKEEYIAYLKLRNEFTSDVWAAFDPAKHPEVSQEFKEFVFSSKPLEYAITNGMNFSRFSNETKNDVMIAAMDYCDDKLDYIRLLGEMKINPKESPLLTQDDFYAAQADIILGIEDATNIMKDSLKNTGIQIEDNKLFTKDQFLEILYNKYYAHNMSELGILDDIMSRDEWKNTTYWDKYEGILYTNEKKKTLSDYYEEYYSNHDHNEQKYEPISTEEKKVLEIIGKDFENYYEQYAHAAVYMYSLGRKSGLENLILQFDEFVSKEYDHFLDYMNNYDRYFDPNFVENDVSINDGMPIDKYNENVLSFEEFERIAYLPDGFVDYIPNNKINISKIEEFLEKYSGNNLE